MFGLFSKKPKTGPTTVSATLLFDEGFCHSSGLPSPQTYSIPRDTTDLVFRFPDFESFWQTYVNRNPYLSDESLVALRDGQAKFVFQVVQGGAYLFADGVSDDGAAILNAGSLVPLSAQTPLTSFASGALAIGLYYPGSMRFEVLWATLYDQA
jgi:hypothetical protein